VLFAVAICSSSQFELMVFVPAGALDIVPGRRLMALKTLVDARVRSAGDFLRNHIEVLHVMTRRCLMALRTVHRASGRVAVFGDRPAVGRMAWGAIPAEQIEMAIVVAAAGSEILEIPKTRREEVWCCVHRIVMVGRSATVAGLPACEPPVGLARQHLVDGRT